MEKLATTTTSKTPMSMSRDGAERAGRAPGVAGSAGRYQRWLDYLVSESWESGAMRAAALLPGLCSHSFSLHSAAWLLLVACATCRQPAESRATTGWVLLHTGRQGLDYTVRKSSRQHFLLSIVL